jgi:DNA mismatch repair ATPase MutS
MSVAPLFANSRLLGIEGNTLAIEVSGNKFNLSRIRLSKNMDILKQVASRVMGREVTVSITENLTESEDVRAVKEKENQLRAEAMGHPLVGDVMDVLGGKVVDVRVLQETGEGKK